MIGHVLVPVDGSTFSEHALPLALAIAEHAHASLELVRVHSMAAVGYSGSDLLSNVTVDAVSWDQERAELDDLTRRLRNASPIPLISVLLEGTVTEALVRQVQRKRADLIVMVSHARGPLGRFWLGSVAAHLIRHSAVPILLVRPREQAPRLTERPNLHRILVPLDGSDLAEHILAPTVELANLLDAEITLLRVIEPAISVVHGQGGEGPDAAGPAMLLTVREEAQRYLSRMAARLQAQSVRVRTRVMIAPSPTTAILEAAPAMDLIALATHGRGALGRLILGSVADQVVRDAPSAVLVHRPTLASALAQVDRPLVTIGTGLAGPGGACSCGRLRESADPAHPGCYHHP
jgi:nucleotide-binding universal stress UspA family protein